MKAPSAAYIEVDIAQQLLNLVEAGKALQSFSISTAKNGPGELKDSECTPRGWHAVAEKIGEGMPVNTVFKGRVPTGELYSKPLFDQAPNRDWILTRILWLKGLEPGKNQGGDVDTYQRYIYIHGCPDEFPMGVPLSHGCIRMRHKDLLSVFSFAEIDTRVLIK